MPYTMRKRIHVTIISVGKESVEEKHHQHDDLFELMEFFKRKYKTTPLDMRTYVSVGTSLDERNFRVDYEVDPSITFFDGEEGHSIHDVLEKEKRLLESTGYRHDVFFFVFLTHLDRIGNQEVHTFNYSDKHTDELITLTNGITCLTGKPKIFLIEAQEPGLTKFAAGEAKKLPTDADRLILKSISNQKDAWGDKFQKHLRHHCSFFVRAFISVLDDNTDEDFLTLTTKINGKIKKVNESHPLPLTSSTLRQLLYLDN